MKKCLLGFLVFFCIQNFCHAQGEFRIQNKRKSDKIKFKLINNLIVIPVQINGVELSFILDTGVSKPILFNFLNVTDSLSFKNTEKIFLRGLGEGESVEALRSKNNVIEIGEAININQDLFAVFNSKLNFAPRLGVPIHGIIGYDFFKDLVVEINYSNKYIRITESEAYQYEKCKKCEVLKLDFYNKKPYLKAQVTINDKIVPVKLLIDSGGSDALWLFEDDTLNIKAPNNHFKDFLGHGLSGSVYGKRSKIEVFTLNDFSLNNVNVAFPDSTSISTARLIKDRNGSLGGSILKRFNQIVDYKRGLIQFRKSKYFDELFSYNKSGIELEHNGIRLVREHKNKLARSISQNTNVTRIILESTYKLAIKPAYTIVELRKDSPAENAGLLVGDIILRVNNKETHASSLQDIMQLFFEKEGKEIRLKVDRNGREMSFKFRLERLIK